MNRRGWKYGLVLVLGALVGVLAIGVARYVMMPPAPITHYHANFAVFLDGKRLDLSGEQYMQSVTLCKADPERVYPEERVHLHNGNPDVAHVHHAGATWGHLFANLGMGLGDDYFITDTGARYFNGNGKTLKFILNGVQVPSVYNKLIRSEDRLLISYGLETPEQVARTQFPQVASTAGVFNTRADPAGCSGPPKETREDRLRRAFWF